MEVVEVMNGEERARTIWQERKEKTLTSLITHVYPTIEGELFIRWDIWAPGQKARTNLGRARMLQSRVQMGHPDWPKKQFFNSPLFNLPFSFPHN